MEIRSSRVAQTAALLAVLALMMAVAVLTASPAHAQVVPSGGGGHATPGDSSQQNGGGGNSVGKPNINCPRASSGLCLFDEVAFAKKAIEKLDELNKYREGLKDPRGALKEFEQGPKASKEYEQVIKEAEQRVDDSVKPFRAPVLNQFNQVNAALGGP